MSSTSPPPSSSITNTTTPTPPSDSSPPPDIATPSSPSPPPQSHPSAVPSPPSSPPPPSPSSNPPSTNPPEVPPPLPPTAPENSPAPPLPNPPKSSPQPPPATSHIVASPPPSARSGSQPTLPPPSRVSPPSSTPLPLPGYASANNSSPTPLVHSNSKGIGTTGAVAIGVVVGFAGLGLIAFVVWYWCMRRKRKHSQLNGAYIMPSPIGSSARSDSSITNTYSSAPLMGTGSHSSDFVHSSTEISGLSYSRPLFTHEELVKATNGFSNKNLLGEGGFGAVYKGYLPDERVVAVKQLKVGGGQGEREFKAEVETISRIHHRHLVSLVGYCMSKNQRLLVYEYVPNNTLYFHLHGKDRPVLDWATRVKIAADGARGIAYLHEDCNYSYSVSTFLWFGLFTFILVILELYTDIKSSNILLDNNFEARVSDFGLARLAPDVYTHITTRVMGTFGYMAPEYASSGKLTEKSDVYSFGVVLLELITGRKPVDTSQPLGDESLVQWARPLLTHALDNEKFEGLADPRLEGCYVKSEMFRMVEAAAVCVRHFAAKRPRMVQVARAFDNIDSSDLSNGMRPGQSEAFNVAQQSEEIRFFQRMAFGSQNYTSGFYSQSSSNA